MSGLFSRPKPIPPATPLSVPEPTPADEKAAAIDTERGLRRKYGDKGRASTVLTGQGSSNTLG